MLPPVPSPSSDPVAVFAATVETMTAHSQWHDTLHRKANYVNDVRDFGAVGDGVADDTDSFQAAIDASLTSGDPATNVRQATAPVFVPPGSYRLTRPLSVVSAQGFKMVGAGSEISWLIPDGEYDAVIDLDGIAWGHIGGFGVRSNTAVLDAVIKLDWTSAAARSTHNVRFTDISIRNIDTRAGFAVGERSENRQVDTVDWDNCTILGEATRAPGRHAAGMSLGSGIHGNILALNAANCFVRGWDIGVLWNASNGNWRAGIIQGNGIDFKVVGAASEIHISDVRSETSGQFLYAPVSGGTCKVEVSSAQVHCNAMPNPARFIDFGGSGTLVLSNVSAIHGTNATVAMNNMKECVVSAVGCSSDSSVDEFIVSEGSGRLEGVIVGYAQTNVDGPYPKVSGLVTI